ncbi:hypothetical protein RUND412_000603 [Rhizina undulata]
MADVGAPTHSSLSLVVALAVVAPKLLTLVRHGQAHHNVDQKYYLHDPYLTELGEIQCETLPERFPDEPPVDLLVSSPLKRTLQTTILGFRDDIARGVVVEVLPELQETMDLPCDTGSSREEIENDPQFQGVKLKGRWAPTPAALRKRARDARRWLRDRPETHVVAVLHGGFLHYLTEDWSGHNDLPGTGWSNTEFRTYHYLEGEDENATIVETEESRERRRGTEKPLGKTEMTQFEHVANQE